MIERLKIACEAEVVKRALYYAIIVGAILIVINHWEAILKCDFNQTRLIKMGLTVVVPYMVSTLSSVGTLYQVRHKGKDS